MWYSVAEVVGSNWTAHVVAIDHWYTQADMESLFAMGAEAVLPTSAVSWVIRMDGHVYLIRREA